MVSYGEDLPSSHIRGVFTTLELAKKTDVAVPNTSGSGAIQSSESAHYAKLSEKIELSLDDLFKRTKKEPSLYYLPKKN